MTRRAQSKTRRPGHRCRRQKEVQGDGKDVQKETVCYMEKAHDSSYSSLRPPRVRLPPELWERILLTADLNSLQACCLVSSDLKKVVKDEVFARKWLALHGILNC